ncbi:MAG TPA: F0F1 ATP synthase subunit delta, partial [Gaiella sp.]|nr:F0F1 ATP synthase subunit delta [Gaiella sp.]
MPVAHRMYARALYEAALEQNRVEVARTQLAELSEAMETTPELEAFLANPQLDPGAKASVLEEITTGGDPVVRN